MIELLLIILSTICNVCSGEYSQQANEGEFKYFVTIWYRDEYQCSGTIIDERHILIRAYCVGGIPSSDLSIIAATIDLNKTNNMILSVKSIHFHYGFEAVTIPEVPDMIYWVHDIAVLKLQYKMIWGSFLAPIELIAAQYTWHPEHECIVPSWRRRRDSQIKARIYIRWRKARIVFRRKCISSDILLLENEKCSSWPADSVKSVNYFNGSPFVCQNIFIGIIDGRKQSKYKSFLDLYPYLDFIANAIDDTKTDVQTGEAPYVVSIWNQDSFKCGGIILNDLHILTTGYCVRDARHTDVQVIAGHNQILKENHQMQTLSVDNIEIHSGYKEIIHIDGPRSMQIRNNYAVLTLTNPLVWSPTIGTAPVSNTNLNTTGQVCKAYRWHHAYTVDDEPLLQLVWSQESIPNEQDCQGVRVDLETEELCVYSQYVEHPMNVDSSGNPIVCDGVVIGIILPNFLRNPQLGSHKSVLNISPFTYLLDDVCYTR